MHQRAGKQKYPRALTPRLKSTEVRNRAAESGKDPPGFSGSIVLGYKGGKGISEILYRQIGEGVNFYRRGESGHNDRAETVDQPPAPSECRNS